MTTHLVNPSDAAFRSAVQSSCFVDKTRLLNYVLSVWETRDALLCVSRPSGFGKTAAIDMLTAFLSRGAQAIDLFAKLAVAKTPGWRDHVNQHDVIHLDMKTFLVAGIPSHFLQAVQEAAFAELQQAFPSVSISTAEHLTDALLKIHQTTGAVFAILMDNWDAPLWDDRLSDADCAEYLNFLTVLFKGTGASQYLALAFLTGRLPIMGRRGSFPNNFNDFTMLSPGPLAPFTGFTEAEAAALCEKHGVPLTAVRPRCGGFCLAGEPLFSPAAVVQHITQGESSAKEALPLLETHLRLPIAGLQKTAAALLAGEPVDVAAGWFGNEPRRLTSCNDVLTLWIHLGLLVFDPAQGTAAIPNDALRKVFREVSLD